ncbi:MAG: hypothetical protein GY855_04645 [candidate division Zixibacteria bacterium]|nr:hypothetical protein [candidate division Zixibacteria bacterium]
MLNRQKGNSGGGSGRGGGQGRGQGGGQGQEQGQGRGQGSGRGQGQGAGRGQGKGRMGGTNLGPSGECVCPNCGHTVPHQRGNPCNQIKCSECGTIMTR